MYYVLQYSTDFHSIWIILQAPIYTNEWHETSPGPSTQKFIRNSVLNVPKLKASIQKSNPLVSKFWLSIQKTTHFVQKFTALGRDGMGWDGMGWAGLGSQSLAYAKERHWFEGINSFVLYIWICLLRAYLSTLWWTLSHRSQRRYESASFLSVASSSANTSFSTLPSRASTCIRHNKVT